MAENYKESWQQVKHTELYSDPLQAYKRRTFNSATFLAEETLISVSVLLHAYRDKERMVHDCDELLEDSPCSDSLVSCHRMLYNLRKQPMLTHWWAVLKCCGISKNSPCSDSLVSCHPMLQNFWCVRFSSVPSACQCVSSAATGTVQVVAVHCSSGCCALFFRLGPLSSITHCLELHYRCPVRVPVITDIIYRHTHILHIKL